MGMDNAKKEREERQMNKKNIIKTILATAAVAGVCILTTGNTAIGNTVKGFFKDVTRWDGAVVGTEYLQATEEIDMEIVTATTENGHTKLCLEVTFVEKEQIPWKYIEEMELGSYKILDEEGKEVIIVENDAIEGIEIDSIRLGEGIADVKINIKKRGKHLRNFIKTEKYVLLA